MVLVGAGLGDHADDASGDTAILGKIVVALGFKFLNGVHDRRVVVHPWMRVQIVFAVQHEIVAAVARAVDRRKARSFRPSDHSTRRLRLRSGRD